MEHAASQHEQVPDGMVESKVVPGIENGTETVTEPPMSRSTSPPVSTFSIIGLQVSADSAAILVHQFVIVPQHTE